MKWLKNWFTGAANAVPAKAVKEFEERHGAVLTGKEAWQPSEPAQSILRTLKRQRHRFLFTKQVRVRPPHGIDTHVSACDTETGRVLFISKLAGRYGSDKTYCTMGLSTLEAKWIEREYLKYLSDTKARALRIEGARQRAQMMQEYVQ